MIEGKIWRHASLGVDLGAEWVDEIMLGTLFKPSVSATDGVVTRRPFSRSDTVLSNL